MTKEQAQKRIEEIEHMADALWESHKAARAVEEKRHHEECDKIEKMLEEWHPLYGELGSLKTFLKLIEE